MIEPWRLFLLDLFFEIRDRLSPSNFYLKDVLVVLAPDQTVERQKVGHDNRTAMFK